MSCRNPAKKLDEHLQKTWWMEEAAKVLGRAKTSRVEILRKAAEEDSAQQYEGMFLRPVYEVITNNNVHPYVFPAALQDLIEHGQGKFRNQSS